MSPPIFGQLPTGETVHAWILRNAAGASLQVITYGGIVTNLRMPDRNGQFADVVLGFDTLEPYLARHPYYGAIIGRVAGRTTGGRFTLEGKEHQLAVNDPPNHLHGGEVGFDQKLWTAEPVRRADGADSVRFTLESPDGDQGYPGNLRATVTYTLTADNEFHFETEVTTDRATPVALTHHSYFNLAGEGAGPITGHELQIFADDYAPADDDMTLLGRRVPVDGLACDLRQPRKLADALPGIHNSHGDVYFIQRGPGESLVSAARVTEPISGRELEVFSTEECVQFYSGSALEGDQAGKSGVAYGPHQGLCLECQGYADGLNHPALGSNILRPGETRRHQTIYRFKVAEPSRL